jgi:AcrR family transcriptional regulator
MVKEFTDELSEQAKPASLRERQRVEREDAILDAAEALMREAGYEAMTMDDLAARAGISKPTLYGHFPSKEEIAVRAVCRAVRRGCLDIARQEPDRPALERLGAILRHMLRTKFIDRTAYLGAARDALGPAIRRHPAYRVEHDRMIAALTAIIEQGKASGEIEPALSTRVAAQSLLSVLRDAEYSDLVERGEATPDDLIDTLTGIVLNGLRRR